MSLHRTLLAEAAASMRRSALAAHNDSDRLALIRHADHWRPVTALACAQALDTADTRPIDRFLLEDLTTFAALYLGSP